MGGRVLASLSVAGLLAGGCALPPPGVGGGGASGSSPVVGACKVFPSDNAWNTPVDKLPVNANSAHYIASITSDANHSHLHADFGGGGAYGIPFIVVPSNEPMYNVHYTAYGSESDKPPFPIPPNAPIEGGASSDGDRHVLVVQRGTCHLYELGRAFWDGTNQRWNADVGVNWNLSSNALRTPGFTSADAAGLPIFAGLVRYDEVTAGHIDHAVRFTAPRTQRGYILPATHFASSSTDPNLPPMGLRLRLKANVDLSRFHGQSLVILKALKKYGMIVADNGSSWYITGASDARWNDDDLNQLKTVPGTDFEVVDTGHVQH